MNSLSKNPAELTITTVIGLEVHVQLKTESKLFCGCLNRFGGEPNTQVCPVCLGLPGALPVINQSALELSVKAGLAMDCEIPETTKWDRKQYFYPDLPKGYQISQFDMPICAEGYIDIETGGDDDAESESRRLRILRAHLEEDAGKSMHDESSGGGDTLVDLNRCGTPLLEIVSQPDMRNSEEAIAYLQELKSRMTHLNISDCEMQEGSLRVDANVNLHITDGDRNVATPIVEVKNMNSFRSVRLAIDYEVDRQWEVWQQTGQTIDDVSKTTRGWDDNRETTFLQREKEESADYRYFPDPDLLPVQIDPSRVDEIRDSIEELPRQATERLQNQYGIKTADAELIVSGGSEMVRYFETAANRSGDAKRTVSIVNQDVLRTMKERSIEIESFPINASKLGDLISRIAGGELDNSRGRDVFNYLVEHDQSVESAIKALGIESVDAGQTESLCRELLGENPTVVEDYRAGKKQAIGALIGKARGKNPNANPQQVRETLIRLIESGEV